MIPAALNHIIVATPDTLHGAPRFRDTRVFASTLFDYVLGGDTLDVFLADFPGVSREDAKAVLGWAHDEVIAQMQSRLSAPHA